MIPEVKLNANAAFSITDNVKNGLDLKSVTNKLDFSKSIFPPIYLPANMIAGIVIFTNNQGIFSLASVYRINVAITQYARKTEKASFFRVKWIMANRASRIGRYS